MRLALRPRAIIADIARLNVDAIVNAANDGLHGYELGLTRILS